MRTFETGATRDSAEHKIDYRCLSFRALRRFGAYMHTHRIQPDGQKREADNWKKGIPIDAYLESSMRHMFEFMSAVEEKNLDKAEELALAIWFNLQGFLHEREGLTYPETKYDPMVWGAEP